MYSSLKSFHYYDVKLDLKKGALKTVLVLVLFKRNIQKQKSALWPSKLIFCHKKTQNRNPKVKTISFMIIFNLHALIFNYLWVSHIICLVWITYPWYWHWPWTWCWLLLMLFQDIAQIYIQTLLITDKAFNIFWLQVTRVSRFAYLISSPLKTVLTKSRHLLGNYLSFIL